MISYRKTTVAKHATPTSPSPSLPLLLLLLPLVLTLFSLKLRLTKSDEFENFLYLQPFSLQTLSISFFLSFFFCCCFSVVLCHTVYPFGLVGVRGWDLASKALITVPTRQSSLLHELPASASASNQSEPISIQRFGCSKKREGGIKNSPEEKLCMYVCVCESNLETHTHI